MTYFYPIKHRQPDQKKILGPALPFAEAAQQVLGGFDFYSDLWLFNSRDPSDTLDVQQAKHQRRLMVQAYDMAFLGQSAYPLYRGQANEFARKQKKLILEYAADELNELLQAKRVNLGYQSLVIDKERLAFLERIVAAGPDQLTQDQARQVIFAYISDKGRNFYQQLDKIAQERDTKDFETAMWAEKLWSHRMTAVPEFAQLFTQEEARKFERALPGYAGWWVDAIWAIRIDDEAPDVWIEPVNTTLWGLHRDCFRNKDFIMVTGFQPKSDSPWGKTTELPAPWPTKQQECHDIEQLLIEIAHDRFGPVTAFDWPWKKLMVDLPITFRPLP